MRMNIFKKTKSVALLLSVLLFYARLSAQELFVFTEPASNMPAKSASIRLNNYLMKEPVSGKTNYHLLPELMLGINRNWMFHVEAFLSSRVNQFDFEGGSFYAKHRVLSTDDVHKHFRLATFIRLAKNNTHVHQQAIDFNGHNSGMEYGWVATQLLYKTAISSSISYVIAWNNGAQHKFSDALVGPNAVNYTCSLGQLIAPKVYKDYDQPNINAMVEILGQYNLNASKGFVDMAPSVQLILKSYMRLDIGYRFPLWEQLSRTANKGFLIRFEYNKFNFLK